LTSPANQGDRFGWVAIWPRIETVVMAPMAIRANVASQIICDFRDPWNMRDCFEPKADVHWSDELTTGAGLSAISFHTISAPPSI
jgi:hypothetical protein